MRQYDLIDLELLKESPMRWTPQHFSDMGICEWYIRYRPASQGSNTNIQMRLLIRQAMAAYAREEKPSPWDDDYNRKPIDAAPAPAEAKPTTCQEFVLKVVAQSGHTGLGVQRKDIIAGVTAISQYATGTIQQAIVALETDKLLRRVDHGVYAITPQGSRAVPS